MKRQDLTNRLKAIWDGVVSIRKKEYNSPGDYSDVLCALRDAFPHTPGIHIEYFDLSNFYNIEFDYGSGLFEQVISYIHKTLLKQAIKDLPLHLSHLYTRVLLNEDIIMLSKINQEIDPQTFYDFDTKLRIIFLQNLQKEFPMLPQKFLKIKTGHSVIKAHKSGGLNHTFIQALKCSFRNARSQEQSLSSSLVAQFEKIIQNESIEHLYQPIVSMKNGSILGWEALARGPMNSYFHSPAILFPYAQEIDSLQNLERLSLKKALRMVCDFRPQQRIFLNVNSQSISTLESFTDDIGSLLKDNRLTPKNIVFEITERTSIQDFKKFNKVLSSIRKKGFSIAVDDAGAGYSSLQAIAELQPDYIKVDMSIIRNIDIDPVKEALVDTFVTFAKKINATLIAEGIETRKELLSLINLGVDYGQGYLIAKPGLPMSSVFPGIDNLIKKFNQKSAEKQPHNTIPIGSILENCPLVPPETTVENVIKYFQRDNKLEGIVVAREMVPLGLISRQNLYSSLSSHYGVPLYYKKSVHTIMDANPLILENNITLEKASQLAMARDNRQLYDHILVTANGIFSGIVSIRNLLEVITQSKIKIAQYANPLTGLPGNIRIQEEIVRAIADKEIVMLTYADINEFKKYNDTYGFERGDKILFKFSQILKHTVRKYGSDTSFLGHIGGDDFLIISDSVNTDLVNSRLVRITKRVFKEDLTVSLAAIIVSPDRFKSHLELGEHAALAKTEAKKAGGCVYIRESLGENTFFFNCIYPRKD